MVVTDFLGPCRNLSPSHAAPESVNGPPVDVGRRGAVRGGAMEILGSNSADFDRQNFQLSRTQVVLFHSSSGPPSPTRLIEPLFAV